MAKRRSRNIAGKPPRHFRQPRRFKGGGGGRSKGRSKGRGKGSGKSFGWPPRVFKGHSPLSGRSLAGGKGKGGSRKGNPTGADGKNMRCRGCNSEGHIIGQRPNRSSSHRHMMAADAVPATLSLGSAPRAWTGTESQIVSISKPRREISDGKDWQGVVRT